MSGPVVFALRLALTVSLYGFLAWAFITLWRDIKLQGALLASRKVPPISLTIYRSGSDPQVRRFVQAAVTVGRDPICECLLENDEAVSARHARLSFHHNQWWLEDLDSTNGTRLNREKLSLPTVITSGDEFSCGDTHIGISFPTDAPTQPVRK